MKELIGKRFGKLVVIKKGKKFYQPSGQYQQGALCKCDCGNTKDVRVVHLKSGRVTSCRCDAHGMTGSKLHNTWRGMKTRCKPYHTESQYYFDKGIKVCDEWKKFNNFKEWALSNGWKDGLTIDRIDNNKGYYPKNCRFVTQQENIENRECTYKVKYKGNEYAFTELLRIKKLSDHYKTIKSRIERGYSIERAFDKPINKGNYKTNYESNITFKR